MVMDLRSKLHKDRETKILQIVSRVSWAPLKPIQKASSMKTWKYQKDRGWWQKGI